MLDKLIFNEDIKKVFNSITNVQIVCQYLFKDYIFDIKILNEQKKKEKNLDCNSNLNNNNSKSISKYNDSSHNLISMNNIASKNNTSIHPILTLNNSFLYLNSSFKSVNIEKAENLLFECKWKKKYICIFRIKKIYDIERFYKSIELECIEMNHFENAFILDISLYWDSTNLQTIVLLKVTTKDKIIEEIVKRELDKKDKKKIYKRLVNYLCDDLTNLENCATTLIFANYIEIANYLSDITKIIKFSPYMENKRFEKFFSPLLSQAVNCKVYDNKTNKLWQEYIFSGFYADKIRGCQIRWEKKENGKIFALYRISITFLEDNISLLNFKNVYQTYVTTQYLSEINRRKKLLFKEIREFFNQQNDQEGLLNYSSNNNNKNLKLNLAIANYEDENNKNDLNMFLQNHSFIKNLEKKEQEKDGDSPLNSLIQTHSYIDNKNNKEEGRGNLFGESIQNISEIENINSAFLFGADEDNNDI